MPAFKTDGTVTAGTSSPLTDGATATSWSASEDYAEANGLSRARAHPFAIAVAGCQPEIMGYRPGGGSVRQGARTRRR